MISLILYLQQSHGKYTVIVIFNGTLVVYCSKALIVSWSMDVSVCKSATVPFVWMARMVLG